MGFFSPFPLSQCSGDRVPRCPSVAGVVRGAPPVPRAWGPVSQGEVLTLHPRNPRASGRQDPMQSQSALGGRCDPSTVVQHHMCQEQELNCEPRRPAKASCGWPGRVKGSWGTVPVQPQSRLPPEALALSGSCVRGSGLSSSRNGGADGTDFTGSWKDKLKSCVFGA